MATWYVRPDTSHNASRNGTTYATAWGGWSEIVAASMAATDTLMVCGAHSYSSTITAPKAGTSLAARFITDGSYPSDPGSITFTSTAYFSHNKNYNTYKNLTITASASATSGIYANTTLVGVTFDTCTIVGGGGGSGVNFEAADTKSHTDITFTGCTFSGDFRNSSNATGAINWLLTTAAATASLVRWTITGCTFRNCIVGRAVIHLRMQNNVNSASTMTDIIVSDNVFNGCLGNNIELNAGFATWGQCKGLIISGNVISGGNVSPVTSGGGGIAAWGFIGSATQNFGPAAIYNNSMSGCVGNVGFADLFWGSYQIYDNYVENITPATIDACGVLFDAGCNECDAYGNVFVSLNGLVSASNSGAAIMVLDDTNIRCHSNVAIGCNVGIHFGAAGSGQSATVCNNTFIGCKLYGIDMLATATPANCVSKNNIFIAATGASYAVRNAAAAWSGEDYDTFFGFAAPSGHSFGANTVTTDPVIDTTNGQLTSLDSPSLGAGTHMGYMMDASRRQFWNPPSRGAYEPPRTRTART